MKQTKEQLEKEQKRLEKKLQAIKRKIEEANKPQPVGFYYKGRK